MRYILIDIQRARKNEDIMDEQTLDFSEVLITTFQTFKRSRGGREFKKHAILFPSPCRCAKKDKHAAGILQ